jgi:Kef-type K+ transport system membrane component KefB
MTPAVVGLLLAAIVVIIVAARLLGAMAVRLHQPRVIGEIIAGILLGPTLLPAVVAQTLFLGPTKPALSALSSVAVCTFLFLVGLHVDRKLLTGKGRIAVTVSLCAIAAPFGLGAVLALWLAGHHASPTLLGFVLFMGAAMSVTAFPVLARILTDRALIDTPIGGLALACAAVDDVLAWTLLAIVAAICGGATPWQLALVVPYVGFMVGVLRPALRRLAERHDPRGPLVAVLVVACVAAGLYLSSWATDAIGLHSFFGALLFGIVMPRTGMRSLRTHVLPWIERGSTWLLPVFFTVAGVGVDLSHTDATTLGELGLILLVAIGGKLGGAYAGSRVCRVRPRHSLVLATLMNTRGLTELIALTIGRQLGVLDQQLYSLMVVMALVTTVMTGVVLRFVYPAWRVEQDRAEWLAAEPGVRARPQNP